MITYYHTSPDGSIEHSDKPDFDLPPEYGHYSDNGERNYPEDDWSFLNPTDA